MRRLRVYHAILAPLVILAFLTGETGRAHAWLGYCVAGMIAVRLILALTGQPQLGLSRFYPQFHDLRLGTALTHPAISRSLLLAIAASGLAAVGTGLAMDRGHALVVAADRPPIASAPLGPQSSSARFSAIVGERHEDEGEAGEREDRPLGETHEFFSNLLIALVGAHISYLLLFKRPLARFMLFLPQAPKA